MSIGGAWIGTETDPPLLHKKGETININLIPYKVVRREFDGDTLVLYMDRILPKKRRNKLFDFLPGGEYGR